MGSSTSKFRKHLQNGDEVAALHLYNNNADLRKALDPNCSYGDSHQHETPLHYVSRHGMKSLLRIFLREHNGNPNKTNGRKETCLHCVCMEKPAHVQFYPVQRKRAECLSLIINWRGAELKDGQQEKADLGAQDEHDNTALHYAAASGLKHCVEMLVQQGAPLFTENKDEQTPCDLAEKGGHPDVALYLESKMVFSNDDNTDENEDILPFVDSEDYSGLRAQDLQEAKDQLLVETADMLSVPLFTAEALLRSHEWSRETLLEAWMTDPLGCCERSGVTPPQSLFCEKPQVQEHLNSPTSSVPPSPDAVCDICTHSFALQEEPVHMSCKHQFCRMCWNEYLNIKIQEGDAHHITCPGYNCTRLVPVDVIENIVSTEMARRYLQFDIKAFVESNPSIKWCPYPGCGRAVKLPELENLSNQSSKQKLPSDTSRAVDCGNGHYFCWDCIGEAHEPSSCESWKFWHQKIAEIRPDQLNGTDSQTENAANCLWLVTNSKACPNCKSPIQKNEGCNHMKCSKCKYDFCWVCLDQWKRHNSSTGGYFKCNRYEVVKKVEDSAQQMKTDANEKNQKMQELNKFVHYYTRFKNHENSFKLELPLLNTTKDKMMKLAEAVTDPASANAETRFVEDAVQQLLRARRVLKCSYVYGYYLDGPGYKKIVFECMQTELEECTEILSQMVNRLYLRTPRKKIIEQAHICHRKRHEFLLAISKGLVPPETPPALRKHRRRRYSMDNEDEELRKAILASIQEVDPANPWIKDASGRHTNVTAVLDWPDSDDSDTEVPTTILKLQGICARQSCDKPRAKNPRTGEFHEHCSKQCMYADQLDSTHQAEPVQEVIMDEQMDLLRALEMSRLQFLRDQGIIAEISDQDQSYNDSTEVAEGGSRDKPQTKDATQTTKTKLTAMEELDVELQRVLEISAINLSDLELPRPKSTSNIEEPILDPPLSFVDPLSSHESLTLEPPTTPKFRKSRFDEDMSMVVNRVPNKSVDDVKYKNQPRPPFQLPLQLPEIPIYTRPHNKDDDNSDAVTHGARSGGCFGVIKDLSVSNIHMDEEDKMKEFHSKNLNLLMQDGQQQHLKGATSSSSSDSESTQLKNIGERGIVSFHAPDDDNDLFILPDQRDNESYTDDKNLRESGISRVWGRQYNNSGQWFDNEEGVSSHISDGQYSKDTGQGSYSDGQDLLLMAENLVQMTSAMQSELTANSGQTSFVKDQSSGEASLLEQKPLVHTDLNQDTSSTHTTTDFDPGMADLANGQTNLGNWRFEKVNMDRSDCDNVLSTKTGLCSETCQDTNCGMDQVGPHGDSSDVHANLCLTDISVNEIDQTSLNNESASSDSDTSRNPAVLAPENALVQNSGAHLETENFEDNSFSEEGNVVVTEGPSQNNLNQNESTDQEVEDDNVTSQDLSFPSSFLQQLTGQFGDLEEDENPGYFV